MRVEGTDDFKRAAQALDALGDKNVRRSVSKGIRAAATPLGKSMVEGLADDMPRRGGYADIIAGAKPSIRSTLKGGNPRVEITMRTPGHKRAFKALNEGNLRHPVFVKVGQPRKTWDWAAQRVTPGGATRAFEAGAPMVRAQVTREVQQALDEAVRTV